MIKHTPAIGSGCRRDEGFARCPTMRTGVLKPARSEDDALPVGARAVRPLHSEDSAGRRRGTAAVEFAVCLPVIVLLFMGSIEVASMIFLKESLTVASYEGARMAAKYDSETEDVIAKTEAMLAIKDVTGAEISVSPADISTAERGDQITITVSSPCNSNALVPLKFFNDQMITAKSIMVRE